MCRFVVYQGPEIPLSALVTDPVHSIIRQSTHARERPEPLNGDGFGVAWYAPALSAEPAVFRDLTPAWNNRNLRNLARVTTSGTVLAHVRAATANLPVTQTNCHPFAHGRYAFMHNGLVSGFDRLRRTMLASLSDAAFAVIQGTTDSEVLFALFLDRLRDRAGQPPLAAMAGAVQDVIDAVAVWTADHDEPDQLNLAVTDGVRTVVSRATTGPAEGANTLYLLTGDRYVCQNGICGVLDTGDAGGAVLIASEPLFEPERWTRVPPNHLVLVDVERRVSLAALPAA